MGFGNCTVRGDDCAETGIIELDGSQRECNSSPKKTLSGIWASNQNTTKLPIESLPTNQTKSTDMGRVFAVFPIKAPG